MAEIKVHSELNGSVWLVETTVGAKVAADEVLIVLESMKMEIPVNAPAAGTVKVILVAKADTVTEGQPLVILTT